MWTGLKVVPAGRYEDERWTNVPNRYLGTLISNNLDAVHYDLAVGAANEIMRRVEKGNFLNDQAKEGFLLSHLGLTKKQYETITLNFKDTDGKY